MPSSRVTKLRRPAHRPWGIVSRLVLLTPLLLLLSGFSSPPQLDANPGYQLQVLQMDESGLLLELRLTGYSLGSREHEGVTYHTLEVPGLASMSGPGQPQLPALGRLLGTPPDGIAGIDVLETESETLNQVRLFPTPDLDFPDPGGPPVETFALDTALYGRDALFPGMLAEAGPTAWLRHQPVATLRLYPFQYNPARQRLEVYHRLRVHVRFSSLPDVQSEPGASGPDTPYERILERSLLNYAALPPAPAPPRPAAPFDVSIQTSPPALKIFVEEDGVYQVSHAQIQGAGFDLTGVDPRYLRLLNQGSQVAIYVHGEGDGVFDSDDWLEFYGTAPDSMYTRRNVYWLTTGDTPGLRMSQRDGTPTGGSTPTAFFATRHLEENHEYWSLLPNGEGQDHWFWERFASAPYSSQYTFDLENVAATGGDGLVQVTLHGRTSVAEVNPDHHTQVFLNGSMVDEAWWDGEIPFTHQVPVSHTLFLDGENTLTVTAPGDTGASVDSLYLNSFDVSYWHTYLAENDQLGFVAPGTDTYEFMINNFSDQDIQVYDISDPTQVSRLMNGAVEAAGSTYQIRFTDYATPDTRYLALSAGQKRAPTALVFDTPSAWKSPDNQADYLIITHQDFTDAATQLADYHTSQGLKVAVIQIIDVYDEFSDGLFDPRAIRDFLSYAYHNWTLPAPLYVLLVGDANYDYLDYLGTGEINYVPTYFFESPLIGQTTTDNWFACVSGDDPLPDMHIGRFSVKTLSQANAIVNKILAYETGPVDGDWRRTALFVADNESPFEDVSDELIATLPPSFTTQRIYASDYPQPYNPTPEIIQAIDQGALIVNYMGHGHVQVWGNWYGERIFEVSDVDDLDNGPHYPLVVTGNCYNGLFAHPSQPYALAEAFVNTEDRGAIAAWSPTGLGYTSWHQSLIESLYQAMFDDYLYQLGAAVHAARLETYAQVGWRDPIEVFTLFGDPALTLKALQPRARLNIATPRVTLPGQYLTYTLRYSNQGNQTIENLTVTESYDPNTVFQSADPPPTGGDNVWGILSLPADGSGTITVTVRVPEGLPTGTTLTNQASLSGDAIDTELAEAHTFVGYLIDLPLIFK